METSKAILRQQARATLAQLDLPHISAGICAHVAKHPAFIEAQFVMSFWPMLQNEQLIEVDLRALFTQFPEKIWLLPRMGRKGLAEDPNALILHLYTQGAPLVYHRWGVEEPNPALPVFEDVPDLVLTPGLMYDRKGYRLGHGKGFYDRLIQRFEESGAAFNALGVIPSSLLREELPREECDRAVQWVVTEAGVVVG